MTNDSLFLSNDEDMQENDLYTLDETWKTVIPAKQVKVIYKVHVSKPGTTKRNTNDMQYIGNAENYNDAQQMANDALTNIDGVSWKHQRLDDFAGAFGATATFLVADEKYYAAIIEEEDTDFDIYTFNGFPEMRVQQLAETINDQERRIAELEKLVEELRKST